MAISKRKFSLRAWIFKLFTGLDYYDYRRGAMVQSTNELDDTYLFDFKNWSSQYNGISSAIGLGDTAHDLYADNLSPSPPPVAGNEGVPFDIINQKVKRPSVSSKVRLTPKQVLSELETVPDIFSLTLLDEKIGILKEKEKLIVQHYAKREVAALLGRLENRKHYVKHKAFFDRFQNTTEEKVQALLKKHDHLCMKTSDIFVPEFPDDAIKAMKAYGEHVDAICKKKPVYYVIAQQDQFNKAYQKRDPILLVQSPFGFFYQIIGAWDEEMILLSEL